MNEELWFIWISSLSLRKQAARTCVRAARVKHSTGPETRLTKALDSGRRGNCARKVDSRVDAYGAKDDKESIRGRVANGIREFEVWKARKVAVGCGYAGAMFLREGSEMSIHHHYAFCLALIAQSAQEFPGARARLQKARIGLRKPFLYKLARFPRGERLCVYAAVRSDSDKRQQRDQGEPERLTGGKLGFQPAS
ncbi:MAG: hypothetical protein OXG29_13190 [Gammaproteobacteria bacterium]|nr:hypothetical protein [Gammaproteobacteria bacterium]